MLLIICLQFPPKPEDFRRRRAVSNILLSAGEGYFRTPIELRRGEEVQVEVFFTDNFLNKDFEPFPAGGSFGRYAVTPMLQSFRPDCAGGFNAADNDCLPKFSEWKATLNEASNETIKACMRLGERELYGDLYEGCFSKC